jgi:molybdopterin biosynthesis enzyme
MLKAFSDAQGLIIRPPNAPALEAGDMVSVLVLPDGL